MYMINTWLNILELAVSAVESGNFDVVGNSY